MASFAAGKPDAKPTEDDGEEVQEVTQKHSNIRQERKHDVRWEGAPVRLYRVRDRTEATGWRQESQCLVPMWLRDLWPTHDFDPCAIWNAEKEKEADDADKAKADAAAAKKRGGKSGAVKAPKASKKELIQSDNARKLYEELEDKDLERLKNAQKKSERKMLATLRMSTPYGHIYQMLEILSDAVDARDRKNTFDVLWTIESLPLYQAAVAEEAAIKGDDDEKDDKDKKKKDKKDKDKDDKKDKKKDKPVRRSKECQLVYDFKKPLRKAKKMREEEDLVAFQLTEMSDRLPPLSKFSSGFKLDEWQKRVLREVDKRNSAIVCAPTSSGKTVISSYVTAANGRVLFVVPTEPLAWQVAALFHKLLKGEVGLCINSGGFRPDTNLRVIVGTPAALETTLSKLRGPVGEEYANKLDYVQLPGAFTFDYAVYDEVHSLDGEEGGALQRLIRTVNCNFLALSATIGNATQLQAWWNMVASEQARDAPLIEAERSVEDRATSAPPQRISTDVFLEQHSGRFINLQRYVWTNQQFQPLHPLAAVSFSMLQEEDCFSKVSLPFTPRDVYELWTSMKAAFPEDRISDLDPDTFFGQFQDAQRITLQMAKQYEDALCSRLEKLAADLPEQTQKLLEKFSTSTVGSETTIYQAVQDMRNKELTPAIMFHLDSFMALELFKELLKEMELGQAQKYPDYLEELRKKAAELLRIRQQAEKKRVNEKDQEEDAKDQMGDLDMSSQFVDTAAPHPEFVLSPPQSRISTKEYDDICEELAGPRSELRGRGHPFLRALRRGFGIYIDDLSFPKYRRVVQRLAQQGKLAFVFSDESLAYGVNMPFRSCAFCGSMDGLLTPLLAQQMSGRAGRRGLDTQGNLLYMNMSWERIRHLMLGSIPAIQGQDPEYPTLALQPALSEVAPGEPFPPKGHARKAQFSHYVTRTMARHIGGRTLRQFNEGIEQERNYLEVSQDVMRHLGFLDEDNELAKSRTLCVCLWELRKYLAESIAFVLLIDKIMAYFVTGKPKDFGEAVVVQVEFAALLLLVYDRVPCPPEVTPLQELPFWSKAADRQEHLQDWQAGIAKAQSDIRGLPDEDKMKLPVPLDEPLDSRVFQVLLANSFQPLGAMDSSTRYEIMGRLHKLGAVLITMHNTLMLEDPYDQLEILLRKTFMRLRYIIADSITEESNQEDETEGAAEVEEGPAIVEDAIPVIATEAEKPKKKKKQLPMDGSVVTSAEDTSQGAEETKGSS